MFSHKRTFYSNFYLEQKPERDLKKIVGRCDGIMRRDEIRSFGGTGIYGNENVDKIRLRYLLTPAMELTEADMGSVEMMRGWDTRLSETRISSSSR